MWFLSDPFLEDRGIPSPCFGDVPPPFDQCLLGGLGSLPFSVFSQMHLAIPSFFFSVVGAFFFETFFFASPDGLRDVSVARLISHCPKTRRAPFPLSKGLRCPPFPLHPGNANSAEEYKLLGFHVTSLPLLLSWSRFFSQRAQSPFSSFLLETDCSDTLESERLAVISISPLASGRRIFPLLPARFPFFSSPDFSAFLTTREALGPFLRTNDFMKSFSSLPPSGTNAFFSHPQRPFLYATFPPMRNSRPYRSKKLLELSDLLPPFFNSS